MLQDPEGQVEDPTVTRRSMLRGVGGVTAGVVGLAAAASAQQPAAAQQKTKGEECPASTITFHSLDGKELRATVTVDAPASDYCKDPQKILDLMDALRLPQGTKAYSIAATDSIVR